MLVFVTGVNGQLGYDTVKELLSRGHRVIGSGTAAECRCACEYCRLDITDTVAVNAALMRIKPDAVIHCAAWTAVDAAEDEENHSRVYAVNVDGTANIASVCSALDCKLLYISTDYVFDGQGDEPWRPDCRTYAPLNVYGRSKLEGEFAVASAVERFFIVRTAWVFGVNGKNFVRTMLELGKTYNSLRVVDDQIGTPTYTPDLARLLADMIESEKYGYYHATNEGGFISWYDFAVDIFRQTGCIVKVIPVSTAEYGLSKAKRPFNSRLDKGKLTQCGFMPLPDWKDALSRYLNEIHAHGQVM